MNYQSAPLVVRYPHTADKAFGNYGVRYELSLPLYNSLPEAHSDNSEHLGYILLT